MTLTWLSNNFRKKHLKIESVCPARGEKFPSRLFKTEDGPKRQKMEKNIDK